MYPTINIGRIVLPTAGLIYILGAWLVLNLVERAAKSLAIHPELLYGVAASGLFGGILGARFVFVFTYWAAFRENLLGIIWPLNIGYNVWGGLFFGVASAAFYVRAKKLDPTRTLDGLAPGLVLGLIVISLADFMGGPGYGTLTGMFWGISQYGVRRHPVQIYEIAVGLGALIIWYRLHPRVRFHGQLFWATITTYSAGRLFVEAYRDNAWLTPNGLHIVQLIAFIFLLVGILLLGRLAETTGNASSKSENSAH